MKEPDHRIVRIAELQIDPDHLAAYCDLLRTEIAASLAIEPGVLMLQAVSLRDTPNEIRLLEVYADLAAYQAHIQSPHFLTYKLGTAHMVKQLRLVEVDPIFLTSPLGGEVDPPSDRVRDLPKATDR